MQSIDMTYPLGRLSMLSAALSQYRHAHGGASPAALKDAVDGELLEEMPWLVLPCTGHRPTDRVLTVTAPVRDAKGLAARLEDSGRWLYVYNPKSRYHGRVFIDCTHPDVSGDPWWKQGLRLLRKTRFKTIEEALALTLKRKEAELALATRKGERFYRLGETAYAAFRAGALPKARAYASELLAMAKDHPDDWNHGNALHHGNVVLGRVALREGRPAAARAHLLAAGRSPGSPQLDSFGPNTSLAAALLERGDRRTVARFLGLVGRFWKDKRQLASWRGCLARGGWPHLDPSSGYGG